MKHRPINVRKRVENFHKHLFFKKIDIIFTRKLEKYPLMRTFTFSAGIVFSILIMSQFHLTAQEQNLFDTARLFKKNQRKSAPVIKSKYFFETSNSSGREYLKQQDLFDSKGRIKSSGLFSDDGNKAGDIRYTYDGSGNIIKSDLRLIGSNQSETNYFNKAGCIEKIEIRSKGDTVLEAVHLLYDERNHIRDKTTFKGNKQIRKEIFEDIYNDKEQPLQKYHYEADSSGQRLPGRFPFIVYEYDDQGNILQYTEYSNKEKRKMLKWIYYTYQLDNDYRIIKQSAFNEDQIEIGKTELTYTDSSVTVNDFTICNCPSKTLVKSGGKILVFNSFGEKIRENTVDAGGEISSTTLWTYDDYGNWTDKRIISKDAPEKLNRSKVVLEYYSDQAKVSK